MDTGGLFYSKGFLKVSNEYKSSIDCFTFNRSFRIQLGLSLMVNWLISCFVNSLGFDWLFR